MFGDSMKKTMIALTLLLIFAIKAFAGTNNKKIENVKELAKKFSDRHFGVGSDGIILIEKQFASDGHCTGTQRHKDMGTHTCRPVGILTLCADDKTHQHSAGQPQADVQEAGLHFERLDDFVEHKLSSF